MDPTQFVAQIEGIEWVILLVIAAAILLLGPSKLPELARSVGRAMGEFRRGRMEVEKEIQEQYVGVKESVDRIEKELKVK